jgi:hypothetical protein
MNRFDAQDSHSERIVPGGELSFFGEAELADGGCFGLQAQDDESSTKTAAFAQILGNFAKNYLQTFMLKLLSARRILCNSG